VASASVSLAGVSDLEKELRFDSDISKSAVQREFARSRVGDPALMKTAFDAVSPLQHADRIKAPLLIAHGELDERVPLSQGKEMYDRMRALHKDVVWLGFDNEKHSLWHIENQRDFYEAVFKLLERTIGKGVPPANAPVDQ
jgi:dipeptidyl aminopeptidase/acylaminoacyl peptidase